MRSFVIKLPLLLLQWSICSTFGSVTVNIDDFWNTGCVLGFDIVPDNDFSGEWQVKLVINVPAYIEAVSYKQHF